MGERRRLRADVLDEQQLTVGTQHARDLPQRKIGSVDRAQHERRDDRIDRSVGERQPLRRRVNQPRPPAAAAQPLLKARAHRRVRLDQDQLIEVIRVVRQVQAGAAADLHRAPARAAEQLLAVSAQPSPLADPQERVIQNRERARPSSPSLARLCDLWDAVLHDGDHTHAAAAAHRSPGPSEQNGPFG